MHEDIIPYWMTYPSHLFAFGNFNLLFDDGAAKKLILSGEWGVDNNHIVEMTREEYKTSLSYLDYDHLYLVARPITDLKDSDVLGIIKRFYKTKYNFNDTTVVTDVTFDKGILQFYWKTDNKVFSKGIKLDDISLKLCHTLALMGIYMFDPGHFELEEERLITDEFHAI